jgi:hypothetical protein
MALVVAARYAKVPSMVSTFPLMAASLLLGQTPDLPAGPSLGPAAPSNSKVYVYNNGVLVPYGDAQKTGQQPTTEPHRPILSKLHSWFGKRNNNNNSITNETAPPPLINSSPTPIKGSSGAPSMPPAGSPTLQGPVMAPTAAPATPSGDYPRKMPMSFQGLTPGSETNTGPAGAPLSTVALKSLPTAARTPILPANANRIGRDEKFEWATGQLEIEKGQYVLYYATPETVDTHNGRMVLNPQKVDMRSFHNGDLVSVRGQLVTGRGTTVYQLTSADLIEHAKR